MNEKFPKVDFLSKNYLTSSSSKLLLGQSDFLPDEIILIEYIKIDLRCRRSVSPNFFEAKGNGIRRKKEEGRHGR